MQDQDRNRSKRTRKVPHPIEIDQMFEIPSGEVRKSKHPSNPAFFYLLFVYLFYFAKYRYFIILKSKLHACNQVQSKKIYAFIQIHRNTHNIQIYIYIYTYKYIYIYIHNHLYTHTYTYIIYIHIQTYTCLNALAYLNICIYERST